MMTPIPDFGAILNRGLLASSFISSSRVGGLGGSVSLAGLGESASWACYMPASRQCSMAALIAGRAVIRELRRDPISVLFAVRVRGYPNTLAMSFAFTVPPPAAASAIALPSLAFASP